MQPITPRRWCPLSSPSLHVQALFRWHFLRLARSWSMPLSHYFCSNTTLMLDSVPVFDFSAVTLFGAPMVKASITLLLLQYHTCAWVSSLTLFECCHSICLSNDGSVTVLRESLGLSFCLDSWWVGRSDSRKLQAFPVLWFVVFLPSTYFRFLSLNFDCISSFYFNDVADFRPQTFLIPDFNFVFSDFFILLIFVRLSCDCFLWVSIDFELSADPDWSSSDWDIGISLTGMRSYRWISCLSCRSQTDSGLFRCLSQRDGDHNLFSRNHHLTEHTCLTLALWQALHIWITYQSNVSFWC